jgi:hypothetical protein
MHRLPGQFKTDPALAAGPCLFVIAVAMFLLRRLSVPRSVRPGDKLAKERIET